VKKAIIAVLGHDRPGIISAVTGILFEHGCNIENVSQTILQTEFSGTFIVALPPKLSGSKLLDHLKAGLEPLGLDVFLRDVGHIDDIQPFPESEPFIITTMGPDQKGLVARITGIIAHFGVNVTNLQAVFKGGDDPNNNIMIYEVDVPKHVDQHQLDRALREKAEELHLDISIQHRNIFSAINRI